MKKESTPPDLSPFTRKHIAGVIACKVFSGKGVIDETLIVLIMKCLKRCLYALPTTLQSEHLCKPFHNTSHLFGHSHQIERSTSTLI